MSYLKRRAVKYASLGAIGQETKVKSPMLNEISHHINLPGLGLSFITHKRCFCYCISQNFAYFLSFLRCPPVNFCLLPSAMIQEGRLMWIAERLFWTEHLVSFLDHSEEWKRHVILAWMGMNHWRRFLTFWIWTADIVKWQFLAKIIVLFAIS